jgi:hypothetical protein
MLFQGRDRRTRAEREEWAREVQRLEHQLELMNQKQARLQETIAWQGRLLEQTLAEPEGIERSRLEALEGLLKADNRKAAGVGRPGATR